MNGNKDHSMNKTFKFLFVINLCVNYQNNASDLQAKRDAFLNKLVVAPQNENKSPDPIKIATIDASLAKINETQKANYLNFSEKAPVPINRLSSTFFNALKSSMKEQCNELTKYQEITTQRINFFWQDKNRISRFLA